MRYVIYKKAKYTNKNEHINYYVGPAIFTLDINRAQKYLSERDALEKYQYETFYKLFKVENKNIDERDIIYIAKIDDNNNIVSEEKYYKL